MRLRPDEPPFSGRSPLRVFALVLLLVFCAEGAIMLALPRVGGAWHGPLADGLLDASLLTLVTAPAVWLLAVVPLRRSFEARGALLQRLFESQEQERAHVARDLHDGVGQHLTALLVGLRAVEDAADAAASRARARELREIAALAHEEIRSLARRLRPAVLEELGLVSALERLCADFERIHDVKVSLRCHGPAIQRIDAAAEEALYRIAQEALSNVARHAAASEVEVELRQDARSTTLSVRDDGRGFEAEEAGAGARREGGFGLASIRERARALGGEFVVRSRAGQGTRLEVRLPTAG
jgi:signal transduction histidine kinase